MTLAPEQERRFWRIFANRARRAARNQPAWLDRAWNNRVGERTPA